MNSKVWVLLGLLAFLLAGCNNDGDDDTAADDDDVTGDDDDATGDDDDATGDDDDVTGDDDDVADDDDDSSGIWGQEALDLVTAMVGVYHGEFQLYGLDADDNAYPSMSGTDVTEATNPHIDGDRAQVDVTSVATPDGGDPFPAQTWLEGVFILADGSPGDLFIDQYGEVSIQTEIEPDVFEYEQSFQSWDYDSWANITPQNLISGAQLYHKVVTYPGGVETHDVTRISSLEYEDGGGNTVPVSYTSMEGTHTRQ